MTIKLLLNLVSFLERAGAVPKKDIDDSFDKNLLELSTSDHAPDILPYYLYGINDGIGSGDDYISDSSGDDYISDSSGGDYSGDSGGDGGGGDGGAGGSD